MFNKFNSITNEIYEKMKEDLNNTPVHHHKWEDHCDCEYCNLEVCLSCGEEREHPKSRIFRPNSRMKVTQTTHSDGISQMSESLSILDQEQLSNSKTE